MPYPLRVADLPEIPEPFNFLELRDGQTITLTPTAYQLGKTLIQPRDGRPPREVPVLRLWVPHTQLPTLPHYWDITSKHLVAGLMPYLEEHGAGTYTFTITRYGSGPSARFQLEARPARPPARASTTATAPA